MPAGAREANGNATSPETFLGCFFENHPLATQAVWNHNSTDLPVIADPFTSLPSFSLARFLPHDANGTRDGGSDAVPFRRRRGREVIADVNVNMFQTINERPQFRPFWHVSDFHASSGRLRLPLHTR